MAHSFFPHSSLIVVWLLPETVSGSAALSRLRASASPQTRDRLLETGLAEVSAAARELEVAMIKGVAQLSKTVVVGSSLASFWRRFSVRDEVVV